VTEVQMYSHINRISSVCQAIDAKLPERED
jgi:hypothetical protein